MARWSQFILIRIEFLGFRYHGWQKQDKNKTVQGMVDKTLTFIFGHEKFRTLGCGRTDAKVSADDFCLELFTNELGINTDDLLFKLNENLPPDIRANSVERTDAKFNIIQNSKVKEYHYSFSFGEKSHPFNTPFIMCMNEDLDIESMIAAAGEFVGVHNFRRYTAKANNKTSFDREILLSMIEKNTKYKGDYVPDTAYVFKVRSKGFMRYQVRLMVGALLKIGKGEWTLEDLKLSLTGEGGEQVDNIAPSSGLCLHKLEFE